MEPNIDTISNKSLLSAILIAKHAELSQWLLTKHYYISPLDVQEFPFLARNSHAKNILTQSPYVSQPSEEAQYYISLETNKST